MSQDLRDYDLYRVDDDEKEAARMTVTATVGPSGHGDIDDRRGAQITLETPTGRAYARVSEPQLRDLIAVLKQRVDPNDDIYEATGWGADRVQISPTGEPVGRSSDADSKPPQEADR